MTFIVMTASAKMPSSCWGRYGKVAVLEIEDPASPPKMISERARGVKRIVMLRDKLHIGKTHGAFQAALGEANELAKKLNAQG